LLERNADRFARVAAKVLVGEKESTLAAGERPLEDLSRVRRGANNAAMLAAKTLRAAEEFM
jgi:hypothetical protein